MIQAVDGLEGIRRLEESSPDFVVLDAQMPRLDGWETLKGIRARSDVPVLMLMSEDAEQDKTRGLADGVDACLTKPVAPAEFVARVRALLQRSRRAASPPVSPGTGDEDGGFVAGDVLGSYRIEDRLARGGMSTVYRATHLALDRTVALKVMSRRLSSDHVSRERFANEWRVAAGLRHPNILLVHDAGEVDGRLFMATDLIAGGDLGRVIGAEGAVSPPRALAILEQTASALDAAHAADLVHRDVKPGNILLDGSRAYLTDFGLTKLLANTAARLTAPGHMVGTAEYLSPEQIRAEAVTAQTDVYALGCVIFEMLTASSPFDAESDFVLMYAHLERPVPRMSERRPTLPRAADAVVAKAMAKRAEERFPSAGATVAALRQAFGYE